MATEEPIASRTPVSLDSRCPKGARSSAGERCLHTAEVTGSIPVAPTTNPQLRAGASTARDRPLPHRGNVVVTDLDSRHREVVVFSDSYRPARRARMAQEWDLDYDYDSCADCTCCTRQGCNRGPDSTCPVGGEGTYHEGESLCPCTEPLG